MYFSSILCSTSCSKNPENIGKTLKLGLFLPLKVSLMLASISYKLVRAFVEFFPPLASAARARSFQFATTLLPLRTDRYTKIHLESVPQFYCYDAFVT